jgi:hypothetical protein
MGKSLPLKVNFLVLGSFDNSKFLEIFILISFFNDGKFSWVNKRHPYEMDENKKLHKRALDEEETNGKKCIESASTHNETKTIFVPNWFY